MRYRRDHSRVAIFEPTENVASTVVAKVSHTRVTRAYGTVAFYTVDAVRKRARLR